MYREWAAAAERAIVTRHLRRVWLLPGTILGRSGWPPSSDQRVHWHWNYWWQAHLLDCLIDAQRRDPTPAREATIERFLASIRLRNFGRWTNDYYDDMAWLGLAMQRAGRDVEVILAELRGAWTPEGGGGIWWRRNDRFKNAPSNGPAAILHARVGEQDRARELFEWMDSTLVDPDTGLVWDGLRVDDGELVKAIYTYCQGVFLGTCLELSEVDAAVRTVRAVAEHCAPGGVLRGQGGGDGGLFAGILARYLALAAQRLPAPEGEVARDLVLGSARACWAGASEAPGGPLFSSEWSRPAPDEASRDLSVQVGAWLLLEAAATLQQPQE
ncbi:fructose-bisphosphate aldolase [Amycolatopsis acidiphila]|uniref:Fructose-bisphosphate aldolase n=1 Tax=Amycolatopsis acidiphila TaxID=715473 RepID=A0A558AGU0_9PSEU|nr:glycoside hydrolase family 76 protein [Amycolatopsis acidiphila]TVT23473.1 fructose-bisphosphate aldolase [Amycolatopsis acidiphila]UIJ59932.1 fructose-bisphosphate aldolase [Amycolatopsis acidiphila]GHG62359.1 glycoside hydrolase [Amycolatopsis acidiphila]